MDLTTTICITAVGVFAAGALIVGVIQRFQLLKKARDIAEDLANVHTPDLFFPVDKEEETLEEEADTGEGAETEDGEDE